MDHMPNHSLAYLPSATPSPQVNAISRTLNDDFQSLLAMNSHDTTQHTHRFHGDKAALFP